MIRNDERLYCVADYETFSEAPLKLCGGWEYSVHKSTEILCAAYRVGTRKTLKTAKTQLWLASDYRAQVDSNGGFAGLLNAFRNPEVQLVAQNAGFEIMITRNVFATKYMPSKREELQAIPIERWHCTAAMSRSIGIPGNLEGAGAAMRLEVQKNPEGKKLIRELCMPRKPTKKDPSTRCNDVQKLFDLGRYCVQDVDTTVELFLSLPPLHEKERKFWALSQRMNFRGFAVDRKLVKGALQLIAKESRRLDCRTREITGGRLSSARQRDKVLKFVRYAGLVLPDLKAKTVQDLLAEHQPKPGQEKAFELLEIRDAISRSSTAKYSQFEMRSRSDGRARDNTIWFGAHTGRDAGTGLQPHNLFKTVLKQPDLEAGLKLMHAVDTHAIQALFPKPMELYASALRSCIVAPKGKTLEVGDFATIEVRVLFWLANEKFGLKQIEDKRDLYIEMAAKIYKECPIKLLKAYKDGDKKAFLKRQLGKQCVLGAGFGIGVGGEKFLLTALSYGLDISLEIAQAAVRAYRDLYPRVPIFWTNIEAAAIAAIRNPTKRYRLGHLVWAMEGNRLTCTLPIGRKLSYFGARIGTKQTLYGPRQTLEYLGVLSPSKIFGRVHSWGGKLTENCVQAVARDCLYESLLALEEQEIRLPVLAVHDEVVAEKDTETLYYINAPCDLPGFINTMAQPPLWAKGLPIKVEGWNERRYRK